MASPEPTPPAALRVLVVEDDAGAAGALTRLLERSGYLVNVANDGPTALVIAALTPPHVILLDLRLPGLDGHEVARRVRALGLPRRPVLIALTGYDDEAARVWASEGTVDLLLTKPVDPQDLLRVLGGYARLLHTRAD